MTMCVESDDGPWEEVVKGNRYPHMAEHILMLEHDTTFQVFEDPDSELEGILNGLDSESDGPDALISSSDSGDDEQQLPKEEEHDDAVWLDDVDEDLMKSSDPLSPCCLLACTPRGRNCLMAMLFDMNYDREQEEEQPEPPPAVECTPPCAGRRIWRRFKPRCNKYGP